MSEAHGRRGDIGRRGLALASFFMPLAAYATCLSPFPAEWDTGEMQTAPYVLGVPHATGFPFFMLAGWAFSHVVAFGSVAWRMNFLSACAVAGTACTLALTARTLGAGSWAALFASFIFAGGDVVWAKATQADVHAFALVWIALGIYWAVRYLEGAAPRALLYAALAVGLGLATHPNALWTIPALAFGYAARRPRTLRTALAALGGLLAPLALYAYLPLRSLAVAAAGGDPTERLPVPPGIVPFSIVTDTNQTRTLAGFLRELAPSGGTLFGALPAFTRFAQYPAYAAFWWNAAVPECGALAIGLAVAGALTLVRTNRRAAILLFLGGFSGVPYAVAWAPGEADVTRYFLPSFYTLALYAAFAPQYFSAFATRYSRPYVAIATALLLAAAAELAWPHRSDIARAHFDTGAQSIIEDARRDTPPDAIVIAAWQDATAFAYARDIERNFGSRLIISNGPLDLVPVIPAWSRLHPVYVFSGWILEREIPLLPQTWVTVRASSDPSHPIYQLCANARTCPLP